MQTQDFPEIFEALTGKLPFPWQTALFARFIAGTGSIPTSVSIPTGLGKTSIVAIWLIALAHHPDRVPRRLAYVVNRRTVVDQTTAEVEKWRARLQSPDLAKLRDLRERLNALRAIPPLAAASNDSPLAISTLRGRFADNREWSADPARPAVIVGTVDMIGSRLLFSGYTIGFKIRPHHAALLAQDTLLVHDEAHLEPAFQQLLENLVAAQKASADRRKLRVIALTATSRPSAVSPHSKSFGLDENPNDKDSDNEIVRQRINATKRFSLVALGDGEKLDAKLIALAKEKAGERSVILFARSVETALKIAAGLDKGRYKGKVATLTGTMRGKERDELATINPVFQRFLSEKDRAPNAESATGTVFLVATSAGEVGVNLSADDLICDLSTYESMAQRFGRVNRFGQLNDSTITVVYARDMEVKYDEGLAKAKNAPKDAAKKVRTYEAKNRINLSLLKTLELLRHLATLNNGVGDASPAALETLPTASRAAAFSPLPEMRVATDIQFDAWALTSTRKPLAARPLVAPYLHGEAEWEPPETYVAWREEVQLPTSGMLLESYPPEELLEDFPLKPRELLRDTTERVVDRLLKIAGALQKNGRAIPDAWLVLEEGKVEILPLKNLLTDEAPEEGDTDENDAGGDEEDTDNTSGGKAAKDAAKRRKIRFVARLANRTLVLPPSFGGLSTQGFLSVATDTVSAATGLDVSTAPAVPGHQPDRIRWSSDAPVVPAELATNYRLVRVIDLQLGSEKLSDDEDETRERVGETENSITNASRYWLWLEAKTSVGAERRFSSNTAQPETLAAHTCAVEGHARAIAEKLLSAPADGCPDLRRCLVLAATFHDLGKNRVQWQRNLGNRDNLGFPAYDPAKPETVLAKSAPRMHPRNVAEHYRHEFGSLNDARDFAEFSALSELERDIVLHLVAAHHGRARPHFPAEEILDHHSSASPEKSTALATEIPRRFARLQHRFGRWGLAWLESLLRAADYAASAGIAADNVTTASTSARQIPAENVQPEILPTATLAINPANPGHYFACCGLFELSSRLAPDALAWFEQTTVDFRFHLTNTSPLADLLDRITSAEIKTLDSTDNHSAVEIASPFALRLDWWRYENRSVGKLKTWAGQMKASSIITTLHNALRTALPSQNADLQNLLSLEATPSEAVSYFDAPRSAASARDVGFSFDKLKKGGVVFQGVLHPAVEFFTIVGLQRTRPALLSSAPRAEQTYAYNLWTKPLAITLLPTAAIGALPDCATIHYQFANPSRTKDYRAFISANAVSSR